MILSMNVLAWDINPLKMIRDGEADGEEIIDSIPDPWTLPEITWEELEGLRYTILVETDDYIIIEKDGKYYIIFK
jgi:hypothetical protein